MSFFYKMLNPVQSLLIIIFNLRRRRIKRKCENYNDAFEFEKLSNFSYTRLKSRIILGYDANLNYPKTFNEKLIHRRLFSRDDIWPVITDKITVRDWLRNNGYLELVKLVPARVSYSVDELLNLEINKPVVVKAAWASGMNLFVNSKEELQSYKGILETWLTLPYEPEKLIWAAENMRRGFIVEDSIADEKGNVPLDYKFFCFNGIAEFVQIDLDRFSDHKRAIVYMDGTSSGWEYVKEAPKTDVGLAHKDIIRKMKPVAEILSNNFSFLRVDLYLYQGDIYFGELTQTPHAGFGRFTDKEVDIKLGELWDYPNSNKLGDKLTKEVEL